jgi:hypothetical protein
MLTSWCANVEARGTSRDYRRSIRIPLKSMSRIFRHIPAISVVSNGCLFDAACRPNLQLFQPESNRNPTGIQPNPTESNQIQPNPTKSNQIQPNPTKSKPPSFNRQTIWNNNPFFAPLALFALTQNFLKLAG